MTTKITKGSLVRLNTNICFTSENGGMRRYPMSDSYSDRAGVVEGTRIPSSKEIEEWRNGPDSKGFNSIGESKLPPTAYSVSVYKDRIYAVVRARCAGHWDYRRQPGQALILDTLTGNEIYVKRDLLEAIDDGR